MRALLTACLNSHLIDDPRPIGAALWRKVRDSVPSAANATQLLKALHPRLSAPDLAVVEARLTLIEEIQAHLDHLASDGISVVTEFDVEYPQRWLQRLKNEWAGKDKHPPLLFVAGAKALLNAETIGVVGSRHIDQTAASFARDVASAAVAHGKAIVSGGARGVDIIAMSRALEAGGSTVGFLADSMHKFLAQPHIQDFVDEGRVCLASTFDPRTGFQVANAMARNKYIYAHSLATVVVSSGVDTGGTWTGAIEALRLKLCPLLVRLDDTEPAGNRHLIQHGGRAIRTVDDIWSNLRADEPPVQGLLFS
jgi:predicted Rossmann fold nucleotide-binding protein DprA/Smf involved in DNA uptake